MTNLKFQVENLGVIKAGEFIQKPLTIFCGPNNSGKTWTMYSLYYCHGYMAGLAHETRKAKIEKQEEKAPKKSLAGFNKQLSKTLADLFNTSPELLANARFRLAGVDESYFQKLLDDPKNTKFPFRMPAERNGLRLFYRELSTRRAALLHHASKENIDLNELLKDVIRSRYALPIAHYINWLNELTEIQRGAAGLFHQQALQLQKQLANGAYKVERRSGVIRFKPYQRKRGGGATQIMGLHMTSSTVKSLFGLWFYLENQAQPGDLLMIDEPELNIHPANQRHIARLLARLVNAGLRVVISIHSDYIVREFNSLLMLSQDNGELRDRHDYSEDDILNVERALHEHSMGFSLDVPDSKQKPLAFFSSRPPRYLAKICDALIAVFDQSKLYLFTIEIKSERKNNSNKQLANGRHFWGWLIALCKEYGYLPLQSEPLYIAVLIWKPREKQARKGATTHTKNHGIESATQEGFTARFEIRNRSSFRLYDLIQSTP